MAPTVQVHEAGKEQRKIPDSFFILPPIAVLKLGSHGAGAGRIHSRQPASYGGVREMGKLGETSTERSKKVRQDTISFNQNARFLPLLVNIVAAD